MPLPAGAGARTAFQSAGPRSGRPIAAAGRGPPPAVPDRRGTGAWLASALGNSDPDSDPDPDPDHDSGPDPDELLHAGRVACFRAEPVDGTAVLPRAAGPPRVAGATGAVGGSRPGRASRHGPALDDRRGSDGGRPTRRRGRIHDVVLSRTVQLPVS